MNSNLKEIKRNSLIEILRIISMFLIIMSHTCIHGYNSLSLEFSINKVILDFLSLGNLGTMIFIIISGYFYDKDVKLFKILKIILLSVIYSIVIYLIYAVVEQNFSLKNLIEACFCLLNGHYWFLTVFIILMLFQSYIKRLVNILEKNDFKKLLFILFTLWVAIPFVFKGFFSSFEVYSNGLTDLLFIYFVGAYLKKYEKDIFLNKISLKNKIIYICFLFILMSLCTFCVNYLSTKLNILSGKTLYFMSRNSPFIILISIFLFSIFSSGQIYNKFFNRVANCSLGIYIIHDNVYMRKLIWNNLLNANINENFYILFLKIIIFSIIIYFCSIFIEIIRQLFVKILKRMVNNEKDIAC